MLFTGIVDDGDWNALALVFANMHDAAGLGQTSRATRRTCLEQLDNARQTAGDVLTGHTTSVEGTHRELSTRLTDRLRSNNANGLAELNCLAGGQRTAVAQTADTEIGITGEHRADANAIDLWIVAQCFHLFVADEAVLGQHGSVGELEVLQQRTTKQLRLKIRTSVRGVRSDVFDPDTECGSTIDLTDDQFLSNVDQTAGEVTRVGGTKCGVDQSLTGTRSSNEVLECLEALTEVLLDGSRNHVAARVGHEATHACDLTHLGHVSTSTRTNHHVDWVEALRLELKFHGRLNFGGGVGPNANFHVATLAIGDDASAELVLDLVGLLFELVEDGTLVLWRLDVVDRHGDAALRCEAVAHSLDCVECDRDL
ncbi:unannotated protein [freshwater metagenome]|uniref:Unannotated protein n=1 Tax=freshwater metagenome TaxID=449393 RepID=A0A6J6N137_9ZZZZ